MGDPITLQYELDLYSQYSCADHRPGLSETDIEAAVADGSENLAALARIYRDRFQIPLKHDRFYAWHFLEKFADDSSLIRASIHEIRKNIDWEMLQANLKRSLRVSTK